MKRKHSVDIILPVYYKNFNELEESIKKQINFFKKVLEDFKWKIIISINGKNCEKIISLSKKLSKKYKEVDYLYSKNAGKGVGVINGWIKSKAEIKAYMDVDLATDIKDFKRLIDPILKGYDISTGSRYHKKSQIKRNFFRRIISIIYHLILLKLILGIKKYKDAQCGFKAVNKKFVDNILPLVKDRNWFFESEMMYFAEKKGFKIIEVPIKWKESKKSSVNLKKAIPEFFIKTIKLKFRKIKI